MGDEHKTEKDSVTGVETTGHEWDGIKELNNPAPRWWLLVILCLLHLGRWLLGGLSGMANHFRAIPSASGNGRSMTN
jgi:hypothetical protein